MKAYTRPNLPSSPPSPSSGPSAPVLSLSVSVDSLSEALTAFSAAGQVKMSYGGGRHQMQTRGNSDTNGAEGGLKRWSVVLNGKECSLECWNHNQIQRREDNSLNRNPSSGTMGVQRRCCTCCVTYCTTTCPMSYKTNHEKESTGNKKKLILTYRVCSYRTGSTSAMFTQPVKSPLC